ncbi:MAG: zinc ribbon domain-containing protein [Candidatus Latescibacteria bacterium]|nr:zinc ribbon domain-containing protein [Candidatus Latescibacterota bacterium]
MPIYEYQCSECDQAFEAIVQGSQKASCPNCGSVKLSKLFSTFAVSGGGGGGMPVPVGGGCGT